MLKPAGFICSLVAVLVITGSASAADVTKSFEFPAITAVEAAGNVKLNIKQDRTQSVKVTADEKVLEHLNVTVDEDGALVVEKKSSGFFSGCPGSCEVVIDLTVADLKALDLSGSVEVKGSDLALDGLEVDASGSVEMKLSGKARELEIDASGSVELELENFLADTVKLDISGSTDATVHALKVLEVDVSGAANVKYLGSPAKVVTDVAGSGKVTPKG